MSRPAVLPVQHQHIPQLLREQSRWVLWRNVRRKKPDGSFVWAKMPYAIDGTPGSSTDAKTWSSFDDASDAHMLGDYDGLGFVLGDGLHGRNSRCLGPATDKPKKASALQYLKTIRAGCSAPSVPATP